MHTSVRATTRALIGAGLALGLAVTVVGCGSDASDQATSDQRGVDNAGLTVAPGDGNWGPLDPVDYAHAIFDETNWARTERGLEPLTWSQCAADVAAERLPALLGEQTLTHASLIGVAAACDAANGSSAENLVRAPANPDEVVAAWLNSPGHANNLLAADLSELGVACQIDPIDGVDQMLCSQIYLD